jgi:hypothetical protein
LRNGLMLIVLMTGLTPAFTQSLFESSQSGNHENLVNNTFSMGGFIRSVGYAGKTPGEGDPYLQSVYGQVGLRLEARAGERATAKTEIRFRAGSEFRQPVSRVEIREAYIDVWAGPAGFSIGKMITPWGKGTVFNPTDKLTPLDPTVRSPEADDMHLGFWAIQGRVSLGSFMKVTATWKPLYQPSVLLIDPVPMPEYVHFLEPAYPGLELDEGSYGVNWDLFTGPVDLSLYWFDGHHHWPGIGFDSFAMDTVTMVPLLLNLREEAYRIRMAGVDLSVPLGSWIFRMEGAWQKARESLETAEFLPFPELSYTAELERTGTYVNLVAGYYGKYIMDYIPSDAEPSLSAGQEQFYQMIQKGIVPDNEMINGMIKERVGAFNRLYNYQLEEFYHTLFIVGKGFLWHERVEITVPVIYNLTASEWTVQPGISYMPADGLKISAGYSGLFGPDNSLYDLAGPVLNACYLSVKLTF